MFKHCVYLLREEHVYAPKRIRPHQCMTKIVIEMQEDTESRLDGQIGVRLSDGDLVLLKEVCKARAEDVSGFIRRLVRKELSRLGYLDENVRKAFQVES